VTKGLISFEIVYEVSKGGDSKNGFYVLLTVHISINLDNDQLDAHQHYFTIRQYNTSIQYYIPLHVSSITCAHHQEVFNCIGAASGIVLCKQVSCLGLLEYNLLHCL